MCAGLLEESGNCNTLHDYILPTLYCLINIASSVHYSTNEIEQNSRHFFVLIYFLDTDNDLHRYFQFTNLLLICQTVGRRGQ